jgi:hypothetical protein
VSQGSPERKVVPIEEGRRRRELREKDERLAHAEFTEFAREAQGGRHRIVRAGEDEIVLGMQLPGRAQALCFVESNRVFLIEQETVTELPPQENAIATTIRLANPAFDEPRDGRKLPKDELAVVADTLRRTVEGYSQSAI